MSKTELESSPTQRPQGALPVRLQRTSPSTAAAAAEETDVTLGFVWSVWTQWWKVLLPVMLVLASISTALVVATFQPKYRADARLEISEESPWVIYRDDSVKAMRFVQTQIEMLRSPRVLHAALEDPKVAEVPELQGKADPVAWLVEKGLQIEPVGESVFVSVAFASVDPESAASLVNTVIDKYFQVLSSQKNLRTQKILAILNGAKNRQELDVGRLQDRVKSLGRELPDVTPNLSGAGVVVSENPLRELFETLTAAELEKETVEAQVNALQASLDNSPVAAEAILQAEINALPQIQAKLLEIQEAESRLPAIEATAKQGREAPAYLSHENKIARLKSQLETARTMSRDAALSRVTAASRVQREQELDQKRTELAAKREFVQRLEERYNNKRAELVSEGGARLEFDFAQQELQRSLGLLTLVSDRTAQMNAELSAPGRAEIYRIASPPSEPEQKYPFVGLAVAVLSSLAVPFALAFLWENSIRRISTVEQLEANTNVEVIGEVSLLPSRRKHGVAGARVTSPELGLFEESIDGLRTGLTLSHAEHPIQVLAVTSAVPGEGKTSISSQLAVSIARASGQPVLLIDGDMRSPDIHQIFDVPLAPGLVDVLGNVCSLEEAINRSWNEHVHLLPAGQLDQSPHKLIGTSVFHSLLDEARLWYPYIIIDTPPVLAASEALVIAKEADATLVCAMRDVSREHHVRLAHRRLAATGAETVGTVLNGVPVRAYAYRYGAHGRYGYAEARG